MIIDCDTHFFPRDAFAHMDAALAAKAPQLRFDDAGHLVDIDFPGAPEATGTTPLPAPGSGAGLTGNVDIKARMADYDRMGIERQLLLPQFTGWWSYLIEPELATAMAHSWNVAFLRLMQQYPGRVYGVALVALQDVAGAVQELEWAAANGFPAVVLDYVYPVPEHPYGTPTATHREIWPFFARCEELGVPVFFHAVQHGHRLVNLLNFQMDGLDYFVPSESQMNLVALITSGLLDRYPDLQIVHAEQGARSIKPLAERLDALHGPIVAAYEQGEGATKGSRRKLSPRAPQLVEKELRDEKNRRLPSHYFRNNFYWTIETEEPELVEAARFIGPERFLFATDYPHEDPGGMKKFEDVALLAANELLSEGEKELMRSKNAVRLFKLGAAVPAR